MWIKSTVLVLFLFAGGWALTPSVSAGQAILSWDPPTTNADGSPLTDLSGYRIYYGTSSGVYVMTLDVGSVINSTINNLTDGEIYYFAVTAYDLSGNESDFSNEISKSILGIPPGNIDAATPASVNRVDGYDLISLELAWGSTPLSAQWNPLADLNGDGIIGQSDLNILIQHFGAIK